MLHAVHGAVAHALGTPGDEPLARLVERAPETYLTPASAGDRFTRVEIALFAGRSLDTKRRLYRAIVDALHPFDVPANDVKIVLVEIDAENVGFRGAQAACDVDLGYPIET